MDLLIIVFRIGTRDLTSFALKSLSQVQNGENAPRLSTCTAATLTTRFLYRLRCLDPVFRLRG
jgi:hypothetical protein